MSTEPVDYMAILADLEAKKAALEHTIASFRQALSIGALGLNLTDASVGMQDAVGHSFSTGEVPDGAFLGKSIPEAAKLYLEIIKKKQTTREIAEALQKGGMESTSKKNWFPIVHAAIVRAYKAGGIVKVGNQWGLPGWYPKGIITAQPHRKRAKNPGKNVQTKSTIKAKTEQKLASSITPPPKPVPITRKKGATAERIIQILKSKPGMELAPQQLAKQLDLDVQVTHMVLATLVKSSKAEKTASGNYRAAAAMPQATHAVV